MTQHSSITRRLSSALEELNSNDFESSLVHLFPAIDKTAKSRRPKAGVGVRMKSFLDDEEGLITFIAARMVMYGNTYNGMSFPEAIYKFGRTSIMHEGELDPRLTISNDNYLAVGDTWHISSSYVMAMIIVTVTAAENSNQSFEKSMPIQIHGKVLDLNMYWGKKTELMHYIGCPNH